ncbi:hypothetical protein OCU04_007884 [Sclerotinia nivalis]|uniref:Uncharacterized protein n=1 Tax=Sclerotinia nivalis TaxID=352851 RepID=A0A9X0AKM2_9HELO|nr:hypothetical protein OCU04_007884 [Sclerotinia nivalis]
MEENNVGKRRTEKKKVTSQPSPQSPSDPKPDDDDIFNLCVMLLPEIQRIVKTGKVPRESTIRQALRGMLRGDGVVPVIRSFATKDYLISYRGAHPESVKANKLTRAVVNLYNEDVQKRDIMNFRKPSFPQPPKSTSGEAQSSGKVTTPNEPSLNHSNSVKPAPSGTSIAGAAPREEFLYTSSKKIPIELPLNERRVYFMKHHETSDIPYLAQNNFPERIVVSEIVVMKECPFVRSAFDSKDTGKFVDSDDTAIYDPAKTANRKRCLRQAKIIYLADLIDSSFGRASKHYDSLSDWQADKLWKNTKSWVMFLRRDDFSENISCNIELDELCIFGTFLGAKNNAIAALRERYKAHKNRAMAEKLHPRPAMLPAEEPQRKKVSPERKTRQNDYAANEAQNDMLGIGWTYRHG